MGAIAGGLVAWPLNQVLGFAFRSFNRAFDLTTRVYTWTVGKLLRTSLIVLCLYGGLLYLTYIGFGATPKGFIPVQDKGYLVVNLQLPDSASVGRTEAGDAADRKNRAGDAGNQAHRGHLRPVDFVGRQFAEFRGDVRDARRFSQSP